MVGRIGRVIIARVGWFGLLQAMSELPTSSATFVIATTPAVAGQGRSRRRQLTALAKAGHGHHFRYRY